VGLWEKVPLKFNLRKHPEPPSPAPKKKAKSPAKAGAKGFWDRLFAK
jgi:hypothetical protein